MANFTDFTLTSNPLTSNFVVGYNPEGTDENRYTLEGIKNTVLNNGNLIISSVSAKTINTQYDQFSYAGNYWPLGQQTFSISSNLSGTLNKAGRYTQANVVTWNTNSTLNISETLNNRFVEGDIVSVWGYTSSGSQGSNPLIIRYTPYLQSSLFLLSLTGGTGYNSGYAFFRHNGTSFEKVNDQNISAIAGELRVEKGQAQDPGTPFTVLGRGSFVHGLILNAGNIKFTNGSDHFHLIQASQSHASWQKINGGLSYTSSRICEHTLAFRSGFTNIRFVAANSLALQANTVAPFDAVSGTYIALWLNTNVATNSLFQLGKIVFFNASPSGAVNESLRSIGFTAATYPAKIVSSNAIGSASSNADIPSGQSLPSTALWHLRLEPISNLTSDNWNSAGANFNNNILNTGENVTTPADTLIAPDTIRDELSAIGGYSTLEVKNESEIVLKFTTSPLTSAAQKFLYPGLPIMIIATSNTTLTATNYNGGTPNSVKSQYGLLRGSNGEFTGVEGGYSQSVYDGYIYKTSSSEVVLRVGQIRGTEESRSFDYESPDINWFIERPWPVIYNNLKNVTFTNPPGGLSSVPLNGFRVNGIPYNTGTGSYTSGDSRLKNYGIWLGNDNIVYTMPKTIKSGLSLTSQSALSSSDKQIFVYAGNKDPVHRPVPGLQLFTFERYPTYQPELKETGGIVSKFALGPSCEGFKKETAIVGFNSTCYHQRTMALGHNAETTEENQVVIAADNSILRLGNTSLLSLLSGSTNVFTVERDGSLNVNSNALSSNGTNTFLKLKSGATTYGLKLDVID